MKIVRLFNKNVVEDENENVNSEVKHINEVEKEEDSRCFQEDDLEEENTSNNVESSQNDVLDLERNTGSENLPENNNMTTLANRRIL